MSLPQAYGPGKFGLSFELYPPKTPAGDAALMRHVRQLLAFRPDFFTCTYGAGGSTRQKTLDIVRQVKQVTGLPAASHLTCVGATVDALREYLAEAQRANVDGIIAIRGDPPQGTGEFRPVPGGLSHANELVSLIRAEFPAFGVAVAGYPEKHREAPTWESDLAHLWHKVACGADLVITQLFYDNEDFFRFRDRCAAIGIGVPLVPGILPVTNLSQIQRLTSMCGARLPAELVTALERHDDADWQVRVGVDFARRQVEGLIAAGVPGLHFYVLNKSQATSQVLQSVRVPGRA